FIRGRMFPRGDIVTPQKFLRPNPKLGMKNRKKRPVKMVISHPADSFLIFNERYNDPLLKVTTHCDARSDKPKIMSKSSHEPMSQVMSH
ncbi:hypothetical protein HAX54_026494, partial [Datura stramonium]|nr:hypothetical protein [Datura stramonium]